VLLTIGCMVCIEQPRKRKAERFDAHEQAVLTVNGQVHSHPVLDISRGGMRLAGPAPAARGATVELTLDGVRVAGQIARIDGRTFGVQVEDTPAARKAMIKQIYSGRYSSAVDNIRGRDVLTAVVARLFR
jgi:cellulose synthase (UDP-forming)